MFEDKAINLVQVILRVNLCILRQIDSPLAVKLLSLSSLSHPFIFFTKSQLILSHEGAFQIQHLQLPNIIGEFTDRHICLIKVKIIRQRFKLCPER